MLLYNDYLRDGSKVRCLSYLSVLSLHISDLFDIVSSYPEARKRLRWAQTRIALMRGMTKLAAKIRSMESSGKFVFNELSTDSREMLVEEILTGAPDDGRLEDYFGFAVEAAVPDPVTPGMRNGVGGRASMQGGRTSMNLGGRTSMNLGGRTSMLANTEVRFEEIVANNARRTKIKASQSMRVTNPESRGSVLEELVGSVRNLQDRVNHLRASVDRKQLVPPSATDTQSKLQRATEVDLGPMTPFLGRYRTVQELHY